MLCRITAVFVVLPINFTTHHPQNHHTMEGRVVTKAELARMRAEGKNVPEQKEFARRNALSGRECREACGLLWNLRVVYRAWWCAHVDDADSPLAHTRLPDLLRRFLRSADIVRNTPLLATFASETYHPWEAEERGCVPPVRSDATAVAGEPGDYARIFDLLVDPGSTEALLAAVLRLQLVEELEFAGRAPEGSFKAAHAAFMRQGSRRAEADEAATLRAGGTPAADRHAGVWGQAAADELKRLAARETEGGDARVEQAFARISAFGERRRGTEGGGEAQAAAHGAAADVQRAAGEGGGGGGGGDGGDSGGQRVDSGAAAADARGPAAADEPAHPAVRRGSGEAEGTE